MTLRDPSARRLLPIRLSDIPITVRAHAAARCAAYCKPDEGADLIHAAAFPSDTTYYVTLDALPMLEAWRRAA